VFGAGEPMLRILSLPCSTGEEPYSIAMALLDAGIPGDRFRVDAIDISARALERARAAVYGDNAFRGQPLDFRDRYFTPSRHAGHTSCKGPQSGTAAMRQPGRP
jgi:chemotaxis protein methyltransferase WspC